MLNKVTVIGYLGSDAQVKYTQSGTGLVNFRVAANEKYGGENHTTWFSCTGFLREDGSSKGNVSPWMVERLKKGTLVLVEGRLNADENGHPRIWTAQDGTPRASYEVTIRELRLLRDNGNSEEE